MQLRFGHVHTFLYFSVWPLGGASSTPTMASRLRATMAPVGALSRFKDNIAIAYVL